jgi:hypothetical protein
LLGSVTPIMTETLAALVLEIAEVKHRFGHC